MFGALPKLLDPMRRAKANREGCLCLGPIFDLAQVRSVDMYAEQRVSPAPNAERQHCEALVELIEQAIARRERKLHEEEPPLLSSYEYHGTLRDLKHRRGRELRAVARWQPQRTAR